VCRKITKTKRKDRGFAPQPPGQPFLSFIRKLRPKLVHEIGPRKEQRKFLTKHLKDFGFGRTSLETLLDAELLNLCKHLRVQSEAGRAPVSLMQPLKLGPILQNSISAESFSDTFSSSNFGQSSPKKPEIKIYLSIIDNYLGF
jgi:hypothetical protein